MLLMVIERFKDTDAIGARFREHGRMLPDGVHYHASWIEAVSDRCFQLMEAPDAAALTPWIERWRDLMEFEVVEVLSSADFWARRGAG
jgi:hypothetical protein